MNVVPETFSGELYPKPSGSGTPRGGRAVQRQKERAKGKETQTVAAAPNPIPQPVAQSQPPPPADKPVFQRELSRLQTGTPLLDYVHAFQERGYLGGAGGGTAAAAPAAPEPQADRPAPPEGPTLDAQIASYWNAEEAAPLRGAAAREKRAKATVEKPADLGYDGFNAEASPASLSQTDLWDVSPDLVLSPPPQAGVWDVAPDQDYRPARPADNPLTRALNQIILGNYTDDVTVLGTAGQILLGLTGLDLPADVRDLTYDLTNW